MANTIADELGRIPMSASLAGTLTRALELAHGFGHGEVALEHLLLALIDDADAGSVLQASTIDLVRLQGDIADYMQRIDHLRPPGPGGQVSITADLKRILEAAAAAAQQGRRREINGAIVLAAIVGDGRTSAAQILRAHGLTFEEAIRALQRASTQPPRPGPQPAAPPPVAQPVAPPPAYTPPPQPSPVAVPPPAQVPLPPHGGPPSRDSAESILAGARERVQSRVAPGLPPDVRPDMRVPTGPPRPIQPAPPLAPAPPQYAEPQHPSELLPPMPEPELAPAPVAPPPPDDVADRYQDVPQPVEAALPPDTEPDWVPAAQDLPQKLDWDELAPVRPAAPSEAGGGIAPMSESPAPPQHAPEHWAPPPPGYRAPPQPGHWPPPPPPAPPPAAPPQYPSYPDQGAPPSWTPPPQPYPPAPSMPGPGMPAPQPQPRHMPPRQPAPMAPLPSRDAQLPMPPSTPYAQPSRGAPPRDLPPPGPPTYAPPPPAPWPEHPAHKSAGHAAEPEFDIDAEMAQAQPYAEPPPRAPGRSPASATVSPERRRAAGGLVVVGQLVENIPRLMRLEVPAPVEVRIAKSEVKALAEGLEGGGAAYRHEIMVTKAMSVRLRAPDGGFFIETASPETQWIENQLGLMADDFASWRWLVTPRERGRRRLQLIVSARTVGADGLAAETALPDQVIEVKVKTNYALSARRWAGWIAAAVVGGLLAQFGEGAFDVLMTLASRS